MSAVGTKLNIVDIATMKDPSGKIGRVAEVYNQSNPMIQHIPFIEGKLDTGDRVMVRTSLGAPTWRRTAWAWTWPFTTSARRGK